MRKRYLLTSCAWSGRYASASGTSMSCPHVSGYLAILLGTVPELSIEQVEAIMSDHSERTLPPPAGSVTECEGVPYTATPNFFYGWGSIRVCQALSSLGFSCDHK